MTDPATPRLVLYTTPTCPDCRALKTWLDRQGVTYDERDLTDPVVMDEAKSRTGVRVAPITMIGDWFAFGTFASQKPLIEVKLREAVAQARGLAPADMHADIFFTPEQDAAVARRSA